MDILPSGQFFNELQTIHDTGYFPANFSLQDKWEQVSLRLLSILCTVIGHYWKVYPRCTCSGGNLQRVRCATVTLLAMPIFPLHLAPR